MKSIQRVVDTRSLVTRLYAYGADGMTFASINNGKEYVENTEYSSEIRVSTLDCSSFTNPYQMLEYTEMRLADYSKPSISYVIQVMDLSVPVSYTHLDVYKRQLQGSWMQTLRLHPENIWSLKKKQNTTITFLK